MSKSLRSIAVAALLAAGCTLFLSGTAGAQAQPAQPASPAAESNCFPVGTSTMCISFRDVGRYGDNPAQNSMFMDTNQVVTTIYDENGLVTYQFEGLQHTTQTFINGVNKVAVYLTRGETSFGEVVCTVEGRTILVNNQPVHNTYEVACT